MSSWPLKAIGAIASTRLGGNYPNQSHASLRPLIKMGNIARVRMDLSRLEYIPDYVDVDDSHRLEYGDVLFNTRNTLDLVGKVSIWRNEEPVAYYNSNILRFEFKEDVVGDSRYFGYALNTQKMISEIRALATGTTSVAAVYTRDLLKLEVPVPSVGEQRAIADALGNVDALIDSLEYLTSKKHDVRQGIRQELLTGRTRLPGFTDDWREITLGDHVTYVPTVALSRDQLDQESTLRYLHYGDIHARKSVRLDATSESMPRAASHLALRAGRLNPGDLVFADASEDPAGVGKSVEISRVPLEGVIPGLHTIAARFDKSVLADGFKGYIQFIPAFRSALLRLAAGTKVLATTRRYISSIALTLPGPDEQRAIAAVLRDTDAEIILLERRLKSARAVKVGMMQELLSGRTRLSVTEEA